MACVAPASFGGALAADLPSRKSPALVPVAQPLAFSWSGAYLGLNAGLIGNTGRLKDAGNPFVQTGYAWAGVPGITSSETTYGLLAGAQMGYNFQSGNLVYGAEVDLGFATPSKSRLNLTNGYDYLSKTGVSALGTARLRLGYTFDRTLLYVTGGLAAGQVRDRYQVVNGAPAYSWTKTNGWRAGYTVGAGAEFALNDKWSVKAEGLYYNLGSKHGDSNTGVPGGYAHQMKSSVDGYVARVGLNYKFGGGAAPVFAKY